MAYDYEHLEAFTLKLKIPGCTDSAAGNYNSDAEVDDGSCIDMDIFQCVESALLTINLAECHYEQANRGLKIHTVYKMYIAALKENNEVKKEMYRNKLIDLCDCKTC